MLNYKAKVKTPKMFLNRVLFSIALLLLVSSTTLYAQSTKIAYKEENITINNNENKGLTMALKTNLLYDMALIPNIELEFELRDKFSIGAEWICPWWITKDNGNALQILSGQIEGRYWFGKKKKRPQLTGLFGGLYAGGGYYDLQYKNNGYQGEFFIASGLSGGYAHKIDKSGSLRMEYSFGLGYLKTNYRYYQGKENNEFLVWQHNGNYTWIGPTKVEVSLVWLINFKKGSKKEGEDRK